MKYKNQNGTRNRSSIKKSCMEMVFKIMWLLLPKSNGTRMSNLWESILYAVSTSIEWVLLSESDGLLTGPHTEWLFLLLISRQPFSNIVVLPEKFSISIKFIGSYSEHVELASTLTFVSTAAYTAIGRNDTTEHYQGYSQYKPPVKFAHHCHANGSKQTAATPDCLQ